MTKKKIYTVIDIETTGGMSKRDKITEIAIVKFDGEEILDQFSTLVNPERSIPSEITRITGITNEMVEDAPKFYEVAKQIIEITKGCIFVAHNVRFDYGFIKKEFENLGFTFTRRQLCTVRLSRTTFPDLRSYSLENLITHFGIRVNARHRALDDTLATVIIFKKILSQQKGFDHVEQLINKGIKESQLPAGISMDFLHTLPESCGVYYFRNSYDKIIYIGKSINIKKRVFQHFRKTTNKAANLAKMVHHISFEITGSELISFLKESQEIKLLQPEINKAQKARDYPYFIFSYYDLKGYICFNVLKTNKKNIQNKNILNYYSSKNSANSRIRKITRSFELCDAKVGIDKDEGPCFGYKLKNCLGACCQEEEAEEYNIRAQLANDYLAKPTQENFIIVEDGRIEGEAAVILVEEGECHGYGYLSFDDLDHGIEEIKEAINFEKTNPETNRIMWNYVLKNPDLRLINF